LEALLRRVDALQLHHAEPGKGRLLDRLDQRFQLQPAALPPGVVEDSGDEDVRARADGIGVYAEEPQQSRDRGLDALAEGVRVVDALPWRGVEGAEHRHRTPRRAARRVDTDLDLVAQVADPL